MQTVAELDLPHLPVEDPAFAADPVRYFREARAQHPWLAKSNIGLLIHEFTAIRELLGQDEKFRPAYDGIVDQLGAHGTPWGRFTEQQLISLPVDQHRLLRDAFAAKFTPRFANQLRPMMQATITRLLDEWAPKGRFDFEEFASYFPISNMFTLVGAPVEEIPGIRSSLETLGLAFSMDKSRLPAIHEAYDRLESLVQRLIAERRADPEGGARDDLLHLLIKTADEGGVDQRRLADLIIFFFIAGYDTSKNVLTHTMYLLLQHPDMYERCAVDFDYCRKVLDEGLRYFNPGSVPRFTNQDIVFRDVLLPKDTMVWFNLNISGRDAGVFERPDDFDPDRPLQPNQRHVAFSLGKHMCLGQFIARAQLQEALHQIAQRLRNPRLAGDFGWRPYPGAWGMHGLPIAFTPADKRVEA
ncbi:cytochrome P450 [Phenylobacterium sp. LjRoot225]|uniref:cytochrome P450 n=1 Tax=Phenylobacterium sp. LjRoot225 TaxID=3342285 RepID=UPI003ECFE461